MTRVLIRVAMVAGLTITAGDVAHAQSDWHIENFDVRTEIQPDGGLRVTETITVEFSVPRRGIYRTIPIHYQVALHQYSLRFKLLSVTDGAGSERQVKQSRDGFSTRIRIGNPNVRVQGMQVYRITYEVYRAILHEQDRTVLRWNATGNEWGVPIYQSTTTVVLPSALGDAVVYDAWTGGYGATEKNYTSGRVDDRTIEFRTGRLQPREGITVEISMPETAVAKAGIVRRLMWIVWDNMAYGVFLIVLAGCWTFWYKRGRDEEGMGSIVVQYDPPDDLGPAEIGTVIDETVNMQDISAAIVDMAVRGYIEIEDISETKLLFFKDNDYRFKKKKGPEGLRQHEQLLYDGIFGSGSTKNLSDLKFEFHETVSKVKSEIYRSLTKNGYFDGNPTHWRQGFGILGFLIAAGLFVVVGFLQYSVIGAVYIGPIVIGGILSLVTVTLFARIIPRKTRKGRIAWEKTKGLEEYLRRAEQQEIEEQERQGIFERLLPYAIALGLTDRWATAFEGIYTEPPNWYRGRYDGSFSTLYFVHSLNSSVHAMNSSLPAAPRSSGGGGSSGGFGGGGFGGGGFGGGGGGSW